MSDVGQSSESSDHVLEGAGAAASNSERGGADEFVNEPAAVDRRLRAYAAKRAKLDVAEAFDLLRAKEMKTHTLHGYATFYEYMERALGYAPHTARERLRVAKALCALPLTTLGLAKGVLGYSQVRELTRVVTPATEEAWLKAALARNATQVQELVATHEYGDLPDDPPIPDLRAAQDVARAAARGGRPVETGARGVAGGARHRRDHRRWLVGFDRT